MQVKTWIEISKKAVLSNYRELRKILKPKTKLYAVVKSNAYGHGLTLFSKLAEGFGADGFCVDSPIEGLRLRENGIIKPILVLGPTLDGSLAETAGNGITITISSWEVLAAFLKSKHRPQFHLKIDTGMHRQGFYISELPKVIRKISNFQFPISNFLTGVYTHFASAKDLNYPTFTDLQFHAFKKAVKLLEAAGFKNLIKHAAATGGAMINPEYHLDAVRAGIGLYGFYPSKELEAQLGDKIGFVPALAWHSYITEVKNIESGGYVGYDLAERVWKSKKAAVIPIGYWHGFDRGLSSIGEVLIRGRRARVLGRVSMDLIIVDVTGAPCKAGDVAVILGKQGADEITAYEMAHKIGTSHYEIMTRINPLIERVLA